MTRIRFWWPGYDPEKFLESWQSQDSRDFEIDTGESWRLPRPGATISTVADWMIDNAKSIVSRHLLKSRGNGRWEGLYILEIN